MGAFEYCIRQWEGFELLLVVQVKVMRRMSLCNIFKGSMTKKEEKEGVQGVFGILEMFFVLFSVAYKH